MDGAAQVETVSLRDRLLWPVYQARHAARPAHTVMANAIGTAVPLCIQPTDADAKAATQNCMLPIKADANPACLPCFAMAQAVALGRMLPRLANPANSGISNGQSTSGLLSAITNNAAPQAK